jgi:carbonic anhydrase/acetyltransferase-like protein (isoleucine patch superfamily)
MAWTIQWIARPSPAILSFSGGHSPEQIQHRRLMKSPSIRHLSSTQQRSLYRFYIDTIRFVSDDEGLLSQYKIILVMLHTWTGIEGWAFGGNYDGTVGAMWMHPHAASSGPTLAHEFTHTLQNYAWMLNPGHGFIDSSYVGFFWETHAEFMALQKYPSVALEFDMARWLNTCQFHWSSTRHHYQAFVFLEYIKELDGIGMINRMWNESNIGEHPLETYKRLKGINQQSLNDLFGDYAMRNVTWDYAIGDLLRERVETLDGKFVAHPTFIPEAIDTSLGLYRIPNHLAPQDYGYNIIRLYPMQIPGCDKRVVHLHFKGQLLLPEQEEAGWRYGFVAVNENQQPRYRPLYSQDEEFAFELNDDEIELYLVVTGAPQQHHNYQWEIGFPRIYRYPYDFRIENAWPEGFQPGYRQVESGLTGAPHINGGGFVASTALVDATAYVGPHAQVIDHAWVLGNAQVRDFAIVRESALVEDQAVISGNAIVGENAHVHGNATVEEEARVFGGCTVYDEALVKGNAMIFYTAVYDQAHLKDNTFCWGATLHGDVLLGGDAEFFSDCSDGTYMQFEGAYNRNCDGLDDHPANKNLTEEYTAIPIENQYVLVCDSLVENVVSGIDPSNPFHEALLPWSVQPNPAHDEINVAFAIQPHTGVVIEIYTMMGIRQIRKSLFTPGKVESINIEDLIPGNYVVRVINQTGKSSSRIFSKI